MMFLTGLGLNNQTKSFKIVHKYSIYTYIQFLLTLNMHVTNAYVILFLASAKTGITGIYLNHCQSQKKSSTQFRIIYKI